MSEIDSLLLPHHQAGGRLAILPRLLASGYWMLLALLIFGASPAIAQVVKTGGNEGDQPPTYKMTVSAAAESRPALKYRFLVPPVDQVEGNAATFYYKSMVFESPDYFRELWETPPLSEKVLQWLDMPLEKLPREEIRTQAHILQDKNTWQSLTNASLQNHCDWGDPIRQDGINTLLPQAQKMRDVAVAIALKARLQLAEGKYADAIDTLRLGYCLSRNMGHGCCLVQTLIGVSIDGHLDKQTLTLIAEENSPNLYWALSDLASNPVDLRQATSYETHVWEFTIHGIDELDHTRLSNERALDLAAKAWSILRDVGPGRSPPSDIEQGDMLLWCMQLWPEARKYLLQHESTADQLDKMPVLQAVLLYRWKQYIELRDDYFKWSALPDSEIRYEFEPVQKQVDSHAKQGIGRPFSLALPALRAVIVSVQFWHRREINLLRTIEALRMHAAETGTWPERLADVKIVPVPLDPYTDKPFDYSLHDGVAVLSSPHDETWNSDQGAASYELTLRPATKSTSDKPTEK